MFVTLRLLPLRATFPSHFNYLPFSPGGSGLLSNADHLFQPLHKAAGKANPPAAFSSA
jgi:hypothetical protein